MNAAFDPIRSDAAAIAAAVSSGRTTAVAVTQAHLDRIAALNPGLGAFTAITAARALAKAAAIDEDRAAGRPLGPLAGVPFGVKNLFDVAGVTTLAGSKINRDNAPAARDATLIERLEAAGAVLLGALNMGEYAYDFTGENAHDGPSRNPHDPAHMPGGSSGGSGAAVAAGLVPLSLGSDTNGSIRVPSSLCGLFGLKPTYGRLSRGRTFPFVASLDHLGPLARSARDLALSYDAMQGPDPADPACRDTAVEPVSHRLGEGLRGLRIAVAGDYFARGAAPEAFAAVATVATALDASRTVEIPAAGRARAAAFVITTSEGAALHLKRLQTRPQDFDPDVRDRLIAGAMVPAAWVAQAQKFRRWYREQVLRLFEDIDVILAPATPCRAPRIGQKTMVLDGVEMPVRPNLGIFTQPISFIGLPVAAVPVWTAGERLPIGVQVIGAPWREDVVLQVAHALQEQGVCRAAVAG
jgi:aspartyl-tRNA(Asn)/glutamyl-tRNA(Gln) amidotransferase subunit A